MNPKNKILIGILIIVLVLIFRRLISNNQQIPVQQSKYVEISIDGKFERISYIQLPIDKTEAETIVKKFCEPKRQEYRYGYKLMKKINNEWRMPLRPLTNGPYYATVNAETGKTVCMKEISFENQQATTADKTEYFNAREYERGYFLILNFNYEEGVKLIQEGVDHQSSDGGWTEGKNHRDYSATAFFSLAVASSYLTIENRNLSAEYKQNLDSWESSLKRSNKFLMNERYWNVRPQRIYRVPILKEGVVPGYPFHNQIAAAALTTYLTYLITDDTKYLQDSEKLVEFLLKHQSPEGWYPEMGGPDCSYNAVSCFLLQQLYFQSNDSRLFESIEKSLEWETIKILDDGTIDTSGNSRITNNPDSRMVILAFWNWKKYRPEYKELSQKIARKYNRDITVLEKISFPQNP